MSANNSLIEYTCHGQRFVGFCALPENTSRPAPLVLVAHDWTGRNVFAQDKAVQLASLGYVGFAMDLFGNGRQGKNNEEKMALMQPLIQDRQLLRERLLASLQAACRLQEVDSQKVAAIGFCFGGLCVLDLARSGADVKGVVSFHGLLGAPEIPNPKTIHSKVLVLHGYDDPMVKPDAVNHFAREMTTLKADWQIHMYGNTMHAFTNPLANDPDFGTVYKKEADERSWVAAQNFLNELFA